MENNQKDQKQINWIKTLSVGLLITIIALIISQLTKKPGLSVAETALETRGSGILSIILGILAIGVSVLFQKGKRAFAWISSVILGFFILVFVIGSFHGKTLEKFKNLPLNENEKKAPMVVERDGGSFFNHSAIGYKFNVLKGKFAPTIQQQLEGRVKPEEGLMVHAYLKKDKPIGLLIVGIQKRMDFRKYNLTDFFNKFKDNFVKGAKTGNSSAHLEKLEDKLVWNEKKKTYLASYKLLNLYVKTCAWVYKKNKDISYMVFLITTSSVKDYFKQTYESFIFTNKN